jgi:hypothetical protein
VRGERDEREKAELSLARLEVDGPRCKWLGENCVYAQSAWTSLHVREMYVNTSSPSIDFPSPSRCSRIGSGSIDSGNNGGKTGTMTIVLGLECESISHPALSLFDPFLHSSRARYVSHSSIYYTEAYKEI